MELSAHRAPQVETFSEQDVHAERKSVHVNSKNIYLFFFILVAQKEGSVNLSRWVKNLCGCKGTFFLRDMQEKRKKNEPIFALWHFGGGKCRKCKAKRDENFYIGGIACRGMEEDERTGDVRRKGGVSYPPNLVDAKEETPNERKRGTKVPRTGRRRKTAWRGNAKRKGTGYNINTDY